MMQKTLLEKAISGYSAGPTNLNDDDEVMYIEN
jgi:hypothetical protein